MIRLIKKQLAERETCRKNAIRESGSTALYKTISLACWFSSRTPSPLVSLHSGRGRACGGLAFTRHCFASKLNCGSQSSFYCPPPLVKPTLLQYYCTTIAQYTPSYLHPLCMPYTIPYWWWQYRVKAKRRRRRPQYNYRSWNGNSL